MIYRGRVQNGQIVLEEGMVLRDGSIVEVTLIHPSNGRAPRGSPKAVLASSAKWIGPPDEADRILEDIRLEKWAEVDSQRDTPDLDE